MKFKSIVALLFIILLPVSANGGEMPVIKIIYDNTSVKKEIEPAWGFSALVEFKDAAIEELEKQYNALESRYLAATGEKKVD